MMSCYKCSRCESEFYSAHKLQKISCPYCGFSFKVFDQKRRTAERTAIQRDCELSNGLQTIEAKTIDISIGGLGLKMTEPVAINRGETWHVTVKDFDIDKAAKVVWVKHYNSVIARTGIQF